MAKQKKSKAQSQHRKSKRAARTAAKVTQKRKLKNIVKHNSPTEARAYAEKHVLFSELKRLTA